MPHFVGKKGGRVLLSLLTVVLLLRAWPGPALAVAPVGEQIRIETIKIEGLDRTERTVVERELLFVGGDLVSPRELEESIQRLRNMEIFDTVDYELVALEEGHFELRIAVYERWTILPILQFSFGGDVTSAKLGLYDLNLLGRYIEVGGQYRYLGGAHALGAWFYQPRLLGQRLRLEAEGWRDRQIARRYDEQGTVLGGFMREQDFGALVLEREWSRHLATRLGLRFGRSAFSLHGVPEALRQAQDPAQLPDAAWVGRLLAGVRWGRLDRRGYLFSGQETVTEVELFQSVAGASVSHVASRIELRYLRPLALKSNVAVRLRWEGTTAESFVYHSYVGGLNHIRGYRDSRFHGRTFWSANTEYRIPSVDRPWFVLQHAAFVDALTVAESVPGLVGLSGVSAGVGVRFIVPRVYGLVVRIDLAYPLGPAPGDAYLNAGSAQFF